MNLRLVTAESEKNILFTSIYRRGLRVIAGKHQEKHIPLLPESRVTKTVFDLTPGDYTLSFDQGKNGSGAESMNISVGSVFTTLFNSPPGAFPALVNREFNFTVGSATTGTIIFDHDGSDNAGIVVDNVRLVRDAVAAVPEPSALALFLPVLGVIGVTKMRRNKK